MKKCETEGCDRLVQIQFKKCSMGCGYEDALDLANKKVEKLKSLLLLTDSVVSGYVVDNIAIKQWNEFAKCFPDEAQNENK